MAEFIDVSQDSGNGNESESISPTSDDLTDDDLLLNDIENLEVAGNILDEENAAVEQQEKNLFVLTVELKEVTISLLEKQIKLLDIRHIKFKNEFKSCLDGIRKLIDKYKNISVSENEREIADLQERLEILTVRNEELINLIDARESENNFKKVFEDTHVECLKYQTAYKKCESNIESFLKKADMRLKVNDIPRDRQDDLCVLSSILEENLDSYKLILASSKAEFIEFETVLENELIGPFQDLDCKINTFITAIKKADLAYVNLKPLLFDVLNFDCAFRGLP